MVKGYCLKCKEQVEIRDGEEGKTSRGLRIHKGYCPVCKTKVCRILGK